MDETQIAERLKENLPKSEPVSDAYPEPEVATDPDTSNLPLENYVLKQEVAEFLNLPRGYRNNPELVNQLESVLAWAQDLAGTSSRDDILHILSKRQGEMGIREKADKLSRMYQYVKISKQIDGLYERQKQLYG
jgi:hypothetical protein